MTNLLFVTLDDFMSLSAWPIYDNIAITPNMDALQASSTSFSSAFADVALCNPSRAAILTGQTPWETGVVANTQDLRHHVDLETETLPGILKSAGMYTAVGGKVFHTFPTEQRDIVADEVLNSSGLRNSSSSEFNGVDTLQYGTTDSILSDDRLVESAATFLEEYDSDTPFALFAGIYRPHVDWIVPQEYVDLYDGVDIPIPDFIDDSDRAEFFSTIERVFHQKVLDSGEWPELVRHYLASMSYADAKLGELLASLETSGHGGDTVTMVMSDHGYHLGDARLWHKFTTYEQSSRAPLVISVPGTEANEVTAPVNLSGVAATALELLGLDVPAQMQPSLTSFVNGAEPTGDEYALTWMFGSVSVRTAEYRYTLYETGEEELFSVADDIMNVDNLADDLPDTTQALRAIAQDAIGDNLFIDADGQIVGSVDDDNYILRAKNNAIVDPGGEDTVHVTRDYALQDRLENLQGIDTNVGLSLTGNSVENRITGTRNADQLVGRGGADSLFAAAGNDTVMGGLGDDSLFGGPGDDVVDGEGGNDALEGNFGDDTLRGGGGDDALNGGQGVDTLFGEQGNDLILGGSGQDWLEGGIGDDVLVGGIGWDTIVGGTGTDVAVFAGDRSDYELVSGNVNNFILEGNDGRDHVISVELLQFGTFKLTLAEFFRADTALTILGTRDRDVIKTFSGNDTIQGQGGDDVIRSQSGDDILHGGAGNDWLIGGYGNDTASYARATGRVEVFLDLGIARGAHNDDELTSIENVEGGGGDDLLSGDAGANILNGQMGDDELRGKFGNDKLFGMQGDDVLAGDGGNDQLLGGQGNDTLGGGDGDDLLQGGNDDDILFGSNGEDRLNGQNGNDILFGGEGDDSLLGGNGDDLLRGNLNDDTLDGGVGNDNLRGGDGDDTLIAGLGNDALFGEEGADALHGGLGDNTLHGGRGGGVFDGFMDTFVFAQNETDTSFNRIRDFELGLDVLDLSDFGFTSIEANIQPKAAARGDGADMAILMGNGYVIYIDNITLDQFGALDILI
ncbi:MAG: sulfatase-like hydrolase/transferase [Aliishimia sp.]